MRVRVVALLSAVLVTTSGVPAIATEVDPAVEATAWSAIGIDDLSAMTAPASTAVHLPPPVEPVKAVPGAGHPAEIEESAVPAEGWSVTSHWRHNADGSRTGEFYMGPEFKPTPTGWTRIDPTLISKTDGTIASPGSLVPSVLGLTPATLLALTLPGGVVTQSLVTPPRVLEPVVEGGTVKYAGIANGVDLHVDVSFGGVKSNIVLNSPDAPREWRFHLSDPLNALGDVVAGPNDTYGFTKQVAPDTYLVLDMPYAYEQATGGLTVAPGSAHQTVTRAGDGWDVVLRVDEEWIEGKTFPIVLDPIVTFEHGAQVDSTVFGADLTVDDSYVMYKSSPGRLNGCGSTGGGCGGYIPPSDNPNALGAGSQTEMSGTTYLIDARPARAVYRANLLQILPRSVINSATLKLYQNGCIGKYEYRCNERQYTEQFSLLEEGGRSKHLTHANTYDEHAAAFGTVRNSRTIGPIAGGTRADLDFVITDVVRYWAQVRYFTTIGIGQKLSSEPAFPTNIGGPSFAGQNDTSYPHPRLVINWTPPPAAPTNVVATKVAPQSINVTYSAAGNNQGPAVTTYTVNLHSAFDNALLASKSCTNSCLSQRFDNLDWGTYYARVIANNGTLDSDESAKSANVTLSPAPVLAKLVSPGTTLANGQEALFTLRVTNPDVTTAMPVTQLKDVMPAQLVTDLSTVRLGSAACTNCTLSGSTLTVGSFSVPAGGTVDVVYRAVATGADRACKAVTNTATATNNLGSSTASVSVTICDAALGIEKWWTYVAHPVGPEASSRVNVANGNLVVQATDGVPVQARGRLGFAVRRTYNSQDTNVLTLPGSIGGGWQLNLGETSDVGGGVTAGALSVPGATSLANPLGVTLVDRDGTRHAFRLRSLATQIRTGSIPATSPLSALLPRVLPTGGYLSVCVDAMYDAPPGVELSLWRYVGVNSSSCTDSGATRTVIGFAAERPDRIRYEFAWNGRLIEMVDGSGVSLRYLYDNAIQVGVDPGRIRFVYEPRSCSGAVPGGASSTIPSSCRAIRVTYPTASEVHVTDPSGGLTKYLLDGGSPVQRLMTVVNPPETSGTTASHRWTMRYHGVGGVACGGTTGQLCSVTDPRGNTTDYTYTAALVGPAKVTSVTSRDPRKTPTTIAYYQTTSPEYVTADTATRRDRFVGIDSYGRVREIDAGDTNDVYHHQSFTVWDRAAAGSEPAVSCRSGSSGIEHDACRVVRRATPAPTTLVGNEAPVAGDQDVSVTYNAEGEVLARAAANPGRTPATLHTTYGYAAQYVRASGAVTVANDTPTGNGAVTADARPASGDTLFYVVDRAASLPPRGNATGAAAAAFTTTYRVANAVTAAPHTVSAGACTTRNSGVVCSVEVPHSATERAVTSYTFDDYGQRLTMRKPVASRSTDVYTYTYFGDSDVDLSNSVTAAGWLRGVTDPTGAFVAFGYDRAGHVARTWDRNQTKGYYLTSFPGPAAYPPEPTYVETLYGSFSRPWRYVTSHRDPLGNVTTYTVDKNGNLETVRPPRGTAAGTASFDTTRVYDASDRVTSVLLPEARVANKPSTVEYDVVGNAIRTTDPNGNVTTYVYDRVSRLLSETFTRGTDTTTVPTGCRVSTASDAPIAAGLVVCTTSQSYDGVDNVTSTTDASAQVTTYAYDSLGRRVRTTAPRFDGTYTTLRSDAVYDEHGNVTSACRPREFASGATACTASSVHGTHSTYDHADRVSTTTTYRAAGQPSTQTLRYDRNGNLVSRVDANGRETQMHYDVLDRVVTETRPRAATTANNTGYVYDAAGNRTAVIRPEDSPEYGTGADGDLVVDGNDHPPHFPFRVPTGKNYRNVTLVNGGVIAALPIGSGGSGRVVLRATGTITICASCSIYAGGAGYPGGAGAASAAVPGSDGAGPSPGRGGASALQNGGSGGGGGGRQGAATKGLDGAQGATPGSGGAGGAGGATYGGADIASDGTWLDHGSGGGGGGRGGVEAGGAGGAGGGAIRMAAPRVVIQGSVSAEAASGRSGVVGATSRGGDGGGGGGGTIWITTQSLDRDGSVYANGGYAPTTAEGGRGADGAIRIDAAIETGRGYEPSPAPVRRRTGLITAYSYDALNRLVDTVTGSDNTEAAKAGLVSADGGSNARTRRLYDADGHLVAELEPRAFTTSSAQPASTAYMTRFDYDANGRLAATYRPRFVSGSTTVGDVAPGSDQTTQCTPPPSGVSWTPSYPAETRMCVTRHQYDAAGNVVRTTLPTSNGSDNRYVTYGYTADHLLAFTTVPDPSDDAGRVMAARYQRDGVGRVVRVLNALDQQEVTDYTSDGLAKRRTGQPDGTLTHVTEVSYDADGNLVRSVRGSEVPSTRTVNPDGTLAETTDSGGNTTRYTYDAGGSVASVASPAAVARVAPNPSGTPTTYTYTHDNLLLTATEPVEGDGLTSRRTTYGYDAAGRKTSVTTDRVGADAGSGGTQQFAYYPNDLLKSETGRGGSAVSTIEYDAGGRPRNAVATNANGTSTTTTASYYLDGLVRDVSQSSRTISFGYDALGAVSLRDEYNGSANARTTFVRGAAGLATSSNNDRTGNTSWTYDKLGRLATQVNPNSTTVSRVYNDDGTLETQTLAPTATPTSPLSKWRYTYDQLYRVRLAGHNVADTATCATPLAVGVQCFDYDAAGRLSRFADSTASRTIGYDRNGNRTAYGPQTSAYNADNSLDSGTDSTGANSTTFRYDAVGRMEWDGTSRHCYDGMDRLVSVRTGDVACTGATTAGVDYTYDALDRQVRRTPVGTTATVMHYDGLGNGLVAETVNNTVTSYIRADNGPVAVARGGSSPTTQYLTDDGRGNVSTGTSTTGAVTCRLRYTPFGAPIGAQSESNPCSVGATPSSLLFGAARRDATTGNYQLGSRTYSPDKAAFLTPDAYRTGGSGADLAVGTDPLTANRYTYVNGDPVNFIDPTGHAPIQNEGTYHDIHRARDWCRTTRVEGFLWVHKTNSQAETDAAVSECYATFGIYEPDQFSRWVAATAVAAAPIVVGALVTGGCLWVTAGAGSTGCVALGGGTSGAISGAQNCGDAKNKVACVGTHVAVETGLSVVGLGVGKGTSALKGRIARRLGGGRAAADDVVETVARPTGGGGPDQVRATSGVRNTGPREASSTATSGSADASRPRLNLDRIRITNGGVDAVERHLSRFPDPGDQLDFKEAAMVARLRGIAAGDMLPSPQDLRFYGHELRESVLYRRAGFPTGLPAGVDERYALWDELHTRALNDYGFPRKIPDDLLYHPSALGDVSG